MREGPNKHRGDVVTMFPPQRAYATMPWVPPASNATNPVWEYEGVWMQCFPMPYPPHYQGEGSRTLVHDRLGPHQSGQQQHAAPVRPVLPDRSDRSQQRPAQSHPPKQEYRVKKMEGEVQPMQVDSRKTTTDEVVKVGNVNVVIKDVGKKPMVFGKSAQNDSQKHVLANDHEASSSGPANKYHQSRWCPPGLSH